MTSQALLTINTYIKLSDQLKIEKREKSKKACITKKGKKNIHPLS